MIGLRKSVGFIPNGLTQFQSRIFAAEAKRDRAILNPDKLLLFGQAHDNWWLLREGSEGGKGRVELPLPAIDQNDIWKPLPTSASVSISSGDNFSN